MSAPAIWPIIGHDNLMHVDVDTVIPGADGEVFAVRAVLEAQDLLRWRAILVGCMDGAGERDDTAQGDSAKGIFGVKEWVVISGSVIMIGGPRDKGCAGGEPAVGDGVGELA
jgi:hypothetical protein